MAPAAEADIATEINVDVFVIVTFNAVIAFFP